MSRRGLGGVRALVPRTPPEGLIDWALRQFEDLGTDGLLYAMEWVEERDLCYYLDPYAKAKKVKMVRVQCSCCGQSGYLNYAKDPKGGYGFVHPDLADLHGWDTPVSDGETTACPFCRESAVALRASKIGRCGYAVIGGASVLSASVVGEERLLCLTGWTIERRVYKGGLSRLEAVPMEAYVFGSQDCVQLMGWKNGYSGTAGYFVTCSPSWRQPKDWRDRWGVESHIYGLTPDLVAESTLPHCKLDVYMDAFRGTHKKYPVAYLRLVQRHPNAEHLLMAMPMLLQELIAEQIPVNWTETNRWGEVSLPGIDWTDRRPAQMLGLNREELGLAQRQGWGASLWRLYIGAKETGETLTEADMVNAFLLGEDDLYRLAGQAPVGRSMQYLLDQIELSRGEMAELEEDDETFYEPESLLDVGYLLDYWDMAARLGRRLADPRLRWPAVLYAAHDEASARMRARQEEDRAMQFRLRRKQLWRYCWRYKGLLIRPAKSQRELTEEGEALRHCVGSYGERHVTGNTAIFFIRRVSAPGKAYFTLELDEKALKVRQNRGYCNCERTPEVQEFEAAWLEWLRAGCPKERSRHNGAA